MNLSNFDHGGLVCDTSGSAPNTPNAQIACSDGRSTGGGEYDAHLSSWTNYYNRLAPVNGTCGLTGVQSQQRAPSNATYYFSTPQIIDGAKMSTRGMPGLGNYHMMLLRGVRPGRYGRGVGPSALPIILP